MVSTHHVSRAHSLCRGSILHQSYKRNQDSKGMRESKEEPTHTMIGWAVFERQEVDEVWCMQNPVLAQRARMITFKYVLVWPWNNCMQEVNPQHEASLAIPYLPSLPVPSPHFQPSHLPLAEEPSPFGTCRGGWCHWGSGLWWCLCRLTHGSQCSSVG